MKVKVAIDEFEAVLSPLITKKFPKGWIGDLPDNIAVAGILDGTLEDPNGEITREAIIAEVQRREAIIAAGGDPDAPEHQRQPEPEAKPAKKGFKKKKIVGEPEA